MLPSLGLRCARVVASLVSIMCMAVCICTTLMLSFARVACRPQAIQTCERYTSNIRNIANDKRFAAILDEDDKKKMLDKAKEMVAWLDEHKKSEKEEVCQLIVPDLKY